MWGLTTNILLVVVTVVLVVIVPSLVSVEEQSKTVALVYTVSMVVLLCSSWIILWIKDIGASRKLKYASAMYSLHQSIHCIRDAAYVSRTCGSESQFNECIEKSLVRLSNAFSLTSGQPCRVCIKKIYCKDKEEVKKNVEARDFEKVSRLLYVKTYSRSEEGRFTEEESGKDWLSENSDFVYLFVYPEKKCFFSNNLLKELDYRNSHWPDKPKSAKDVDYVATIVWPLRKKFYAASEAEDAFHKKQGIIGYLAVDSKKPGTFLPDIDVEMGAAVADALYAVLTMHDVQCNGGEVPASSKMECALQPSLQETPHGHES